MQTINIKQKLQSGNHGSDSETKKNDDKAPGWNFAKYLIDEQGRLIGVWPSKTKPSDPEITGKL